MAISLSDIVFHYIDETLDLDDLENMDDFVHAVIKTENIEEWQLPGILRQLHYDLSEAFQMEKKRTRRLRLRSALAHFEADFSDYLITRETDSFPVHHS